MFSLLGTRLLPALALVVAGPLLATAPAQAAPARDDVFTVVTAKKRNPRDEVSRSVTRSLVGVRPSAYVGRYFNARYEGVRRCIVRRESEGFYRIVNRSSGAAGAYQFMLGTSNVAARRMGRPDLVGRRASTWTRFEQDKAFWVMWNHGRGRSHWAGGRWRC